MDTSGTPLGSAYILHERIGGGATGEVWRGSLRASGEPLAIKILATRLTEDPDFVSRFLLERSLLLRIRHPNLVNVRDLVAEGTTLAIVMDLVDGEDLEHRIRRRGALEWKDAFGLMRGVAAALTAVHAADVVHGDVKPANILVDRRGPQPTVQLTDFGIATICRGGRPGAGVMGTLEYMAPEVASGGEVTPAADLYACGIVLYEAVTGLPPYQGGDAVGILRRHVEEPVTRPPMLPAEAWEIVGALLSKWPGARPSAEELTTLLAKVTGGFSEALPGRLSEAVSGGFSARPAGGPAGGLAERLAGALSEVPAGGQPGGSEGGQAGRRDAGPDGGPDGGPGGGQSAALSGGSEPQALPAAGEAPPAERPAAGKKPTGYPLVFKPELSGPILRRRQAEGAGSASGAGARPRVGLTPLTPLPPASAPVAPPAGARHAPPAVPAPSAPAAPPLVARAAPLAAEETMAGHRQTQVRGREPAPPLFEAPALQPPVAPPPRLAPPPRVAPPPPRPGRVSSQGTATSRPRLAPAPPFRPSGSATGKGTRADRRFPLLPQIPFTPRVMAVIAGCALGLLVLVGLAVWLLGGSGTSRAPATYQFPPSSSGGLTVSRVWRLSGGDLLQGTLTVTGSGAATSTFDEVIPKAVAQNASQIDFQPAPASVVQADPVVRYQFSRLGAGATQTVGYTMHVHASGSSAAQLRAWAADQRAAETAFAASSSHPAPLTLEKLSVTPATMALHVGQTVPLTVTGTMSDGSVAPLPVLADLSWRVSPPGVAVIDGTRLIAIGIGTVHITAAIGDTEGGADATVASAPPTPSPVPITSPAPRPSPSPKPSPAAPPPASPAAPQGPPFPTCQPASVPPAPASPAPTPTGPVQEPFYQLCSPTSGFRFYTADPRERDSFLQNGYVYEGIAGQIWTAASNVLIPLYRLEDSQGRRVFTTSAQTRDTLQANGLTFERVAGYVASSQQPFTDPLFQLSTTAYGAIYTRDPSLRAQLLAEGWQDNGVTCYILPS